MNEESVKTSNELVRWLKMLALPGRAGVGLALIMLLLLCSAPAPLSRGLHEKVPATVLNAEVPHGR